MKIGTPWRTRTRARTTLWQSLWQLPRGGKMRSLRGGGGRQPCRFASDCGNYLEEDEEEGLFKAKQLTRWTLRTRRTSGTLLLSTNPVKKGRGGGGRGGQAGGRAGEGGGGERERERESSGSRSFLLFSAAMMLPCNSCNQQPGASLASRNPLHSFIPAYNTSTHAGQVHHHRRREAPSLPLVSSHLLCPDAH